MSNHEGRDERASDVQREDVQVEPKWEGYAERECGDHRTTGGRAWCFSCSEWCYERIPCRGCEMPLLRALLAETLPYFDADSRYWDEGASEGQNHRRMQEANAVANRIRAVVFGRHISEENQ